MIPQAQFDWWEDHYARIDAMMDELMRLVGGENDQPDARRLSGLLWKHNLAFVNKEQALALLAIAALTSEHGRPMPGGVRESGPTNG